MPAAKPRAKPKRPRLPPVQKPPLTFVEVIEEALPRMSPQGRAWFERLIAAHRKSNDPSPPVKPAE